MLFLDLVEQVNVLVGSNGTVLRSDVVGKILIKSLLSDMPELRLGLNDAAEDATFHQCVNLGTFESQKVITFVPPDGEFELMRYRCQENIQLPFKVLPVVTDIGRTRMECNITVKSTFSSKLAAGSVVILVPVPENTSKAAILVTIGKAKYDATKKALVWKVRSFPGEAEHSLRAEVTLLATTRTEKKPWTRPPVTMQFQVPMFNASGLRVAYLQINERKLGSAYKVEKWVRKLVKSGPMGNGQTRLEQKLELGFSAVELGFSAVEHKLSAVEHKIDLVQQEVHVLNEQLGKLEARMEARFDKVEAQSTARFDKVQAQSAASFDKLVDKLDAYTATLNQIKGFSITVGAMSAVGAGAAAMKAWESIQTAGKVAEATRKAAAAADKGFVGGLP
ncbi:hypothetical protein QJQ45_001661 [Haematococcus lacustris]|nr:hypothetical protein QJQ45_001661 [Haematococcus lacustris]